jgi:hypothetical protein
MIHDKQGELMVTRNFFKKSDNMNKYNSKSITYTSTNNQHTKQSKETKIKNKNSHKIQQSPKRKKFKTKKQQNDKLT